MCHFEVFSCTACADVWWMLDIRKINCLLHHRYKGRLMYRRHAVQPDLAGDKCNNSCQAGILSVRGSWSASLWHCWCCIDANRRTPVNTAAPSALAVIGTSKQILFPCPGICARHLARARNIHHRRCLQRLPTIFPFYVVTNYFGPGCPACSPRTTHRI